MTEITLPADIYDTIASKAYDATRAEHRLTTMDEQIAQAGHQNIILWATPYGGTPIAFVRSTE